MYQDHSRMSKIQGISHQLVQKLVPVGLALGRLRQEEHHQFGAFLSYTEIKTSMQESYIWKRMVLAQRIA